MGPASDRKEPESIPRHVLWAATAFLAIFPPLAVNTTSWGARIAWTCVLIMGGFLGFFVNVCEQSNPELHKYAELQRNGPYLRRYRPVVFALILGALLLAELLAVAVTYATPDKPLLSRTTIAIAQWGTSVFPLIGKYPTQMTSPLEAQTLFKTQAVMTLFLLAGALNFITLAPYILCMPHEETVVMHRMQNDLNSSKFLSSSPSVIVALMPFSILMGLAFFLGWLDFRADSYRSLSFECLATAACYAQDDLMLIASGFLRIFASYGFWIGALVSMIGAIATSE